MDLYILRHGIAVDHGVRNNDSERPLTEEGEEKMRLSANAMKKLDLKFEAILSSPYVRARQTAEIVAKKLDLIKKLKLTQNLIYEVSPLKIVDEISENYSKAESILLVGHEPYLSMLISVLVTGSPASSFTLKKGGLGLLRISQLSYGQCASLEWLLTPKQLIRIAES